MMYMIYDDGNIYILDIDSEDRVSGVSSILLPDNRIVNLSNNIDVYDISTHITTHINLESIVPFSVDIKLLAAGRILCRGFYGTAIFR